MDASIRSTRACSVPAARPNRSMAVTSVSGRFSFGSGIGHAGWVGAGTLVTKDGEFVLTESGIPELRVAFLASDRVTLLGNWDVLGLSGTGSYDYEIVDAFVDEAFTFPLLSPVAHRGGPIYRLGVLVITSIGHCGFALGVARRAMEELAHVAPTKTRMGATTPITEQQLFRHDFALQDAALRSARAYAFEVFADAYASVERGDALRPEQQMRARQATTYATRIAAEVVRFAYTWAGTDAFRASPLQRCFRDIHAATQHIFVDNATLTDADAHAPRVVLVRGGARHVLDDQREVEEPAVLTRQVLHATGVGDVEIVEARYELLERDPELEAGERRPDAHVGSEPERDVTLDLAVDVEVLGVRRTCARRGWPTRAGAPPGLLR